MKKCYSTAGRTCIVFAVLQTDTDERAMTTKSASRGNFLVNTPLHVMRLLYFRWRKTYRPTWTDAVS
jgi:hypothetical protein